MTRILVVEDDVDICNLIRSHLEQDGYSVRQAFDGPSALVAVAEERIDLVVLDWMLPGLDGLTVCRRIRQSHLMPIIMLTARGEEIDRVVGLEVGADDYVTKPFGMRELLARVRAILRRVGTSAAATGVATPVAVVASAADPSVVPPGVTASSTGAALITHGELTIDPSGRTVTVEGHSVDLTRREFDLLSMLASNPGRAFSRAYLLERIWGDEIEVFDRTVDSHVVRLRKKLGPAGQRIGTVWGVGYRFAA
jgi:DNA-binding response OmpR family regulator